jgi:hypothetical protein
MSVVSGSLLDKWNGDLNDCPIAWKI